MANGAAKGPATWVRRVIVRNYKSIETANVELRPFTVLVGPNGAGKSNFLDALRFVSDSLRTTLDHAIKERGGIQDVRRRSRESKGHPTHFEIQVELEINGNQVGRYGFAVKSRPNGGFAVHREDCQMEPMQFGEKRHFYRVENGVLLSASEKLTAAVESDRLFLTAISALPTFRPLYDALVNMTFYNLNPAVMRELQSPDPGEQLVRDGSNIASAIARLSPEARARIQDYLATVVPSITGVKAKSLGHRETFEVFQQVGGERTPSKFPAIALSDGTLRTLGILVALHQRVGQKGRFSTLVGVEEPETALHPGAAAALSEALIEASGHVQVLATSHSPELLDNENIPVEGVLAVVSNQGKTEIGAADAPTRKALREHLQTVGQLLRLGPIAPDAAALEESRRQRTLFDFSERTL